MILAWMLIAPLLAAPGCLLLPSSLLRRFSVVAGCGAHLALIAISWNSPSDAIWNGYLALDPLNHLLLSLISLLFAATSVFLIGYHQRSDVSKRVFQACILALLSALTLACLSQHLGLMWVGLEASSLAATPLIYFHLGPRALEATWKFLLMNSVGIAIALLGVFAVALASTQLEIGLLMPAMIENATRMDPAWLRAGFLLALVGFGTKLGLAPLHSWKPDAYGEAPPPVAALFAGAMTLAALLGILRFQQICVAAQLGAFTGQWLCGFGLLSIAVAGLFILNNTDYRRILAYTSVEHVGVLAIGAGIAASGGAYAAMLHATHNTLNKGILFLTAGILLRTFQTTRATELRGLLRQRPGIALMLLVGLLATSAAPPFGMFYSELGVIFAAVATGHWIVAAGLVLTLAVVFVALMTRVLPMVLGTPSEAMTAAASANPPETRWRRWVMTAPVLGLITVAVAIAVYPPRPLRSALDAAAEAMAHPGSAIAQARQSTPPAPGPVEVVATSPSEPRWHSKNKGEIVEKRLDRQAPVLAEARP